MATVAACIDSGIRCSGMGVLISSDWMNPSRVPSAAYTAELVPWSTGLSESSGGADEATDSTYPASDSTAITPASRTTNSARKILLGFRVRL